MCPQGYCEADALQQRPWDGTCTGRYRKGVLCGECSQGRSEAFGTTECVPDEDCGLSNKGWWLITLAALGLGLIYVVLLVWIPVGHHPLWKSLVYFMQVAALVVTANGNDLVVGGSETAHGILNGILTFFALDPNVLGIHVGLCPWSGLTAVQKMALGYVLPLTLFVELGMAASLHWLLLKAWQRCFSQQRNKNNNNNNSAENVLLLNGAAEDQEGEEEGNDDDNNN